MKRLILYSIVLFIISTAVLTHNLNIQKDLIRQQYKIACDIFIMQLYRDVNWLTYCEFNNNILYVKTMRSDDCTILIDLNHIWNLSIINIFD